MSEEGPSLEQNAARLIRAAYGQPTHPTPEAGKKLFRLLLGHIRGRRATPGFPDVAIVVMGGLLALVAGCLAIQALLPSSLRIGDLSLLATAAWLVLNLAVVPVAGIVVVMRRKHGQQVS